MLVEDRELTEQAARIEALLDDIESFPDPVVRGKVGEIVQDLLMLYGEGLARMMAIVAEQGDARDRVFDAFVGDELIAHLLLLHDLHPVDVETRVARALEEVRPYLQSHGGNVELLGVDDGVAKLRLQGSCSGCPSSTMTLKLAIEEAVRKAAPDLDGIDAEGVAEPPARPVNFLPISDLRKQKKAQGGPAWTVAGDLSGIADGGMQPMDVAGAPLLFFKLEGTVYAYRTRCPGCGRSLEEGTLQGGEVVCPGCDLHFDIRRAGRCAEAPNQQLEPVPLLVQGDSVKIALNGA